MSSLFVIISKGHIIGWHWKHRLKYVVDFLFLIAIEFGILTDWSKIRFRTSMLNSFHPIFSSGIMWLKVSYCWRWAEEKFIAQFDCTISGPKDSPFNGGYYHGALIFTKDFPFKPPSIYMYTPNGRFKPNKRLCLSISDFHPDTWNPAWSVSTILTGLLSIMLENSPLLGSCESTTYEKKKLAMNSLEFNVKNEIFRSVQGSRAGRRSF